MNELLKRGSFFITHFLYTFCDLITHFLLIKEYYCLDIEIFLRCFEIFERGIEDMRQNIIFSKLLKSEIDDYKNNCNFTEYGILPE